MTASALAALGLTEASTAATDGSVSIVYRAYQPSALTVAAGQTVTWKNSGLGPHTVTAIAGRFDSGKLDAGATFSYAFTTPGTYLYACTIHPTMKGEVVVLAALPPGSPPAGGPPQSVQVRLSRQSGPHGSVTLVHVQAPRPGAKALLQLRSGSTWSTARRMQLGSGGKATFSLSASVHRRLRVIVQGPAGKAPLISRALSPGA
jgi:plastocyanin